MSIRTRFQRGATGVRRVSFSRTMRFGNVRQIQMRWVAIGRQIAMWRGKYRKAKGFMRKKIAMRIRSLIMFRRRLSMMRRRF
jgi:hypothetical protein